MRYANGGDFRRALENRLRNLNQQDGTPLVRLRKLVAFDRLLARLVLSEPNAWVLKGGLALQLRLEDRARTTKDMDVMWRHSAPDLHSLLVDAVSVELNDWFRFTVEQREAERNLPMQGGRRFYAHAFLDDRVFESFHLDVGLNDPMLDPVQLLKMPDLLAFAEISATVVPCFPVTQQIAEKIHAYTRPHLSGVSSRVKDLVDILLLADLQPLSGLTLRQAVAATFNAQDAHPLPLALPAPPENWRQPLRRMADETGLVWREISEVTRAAREFVDPVLQRQDSGQWDPVTWTWEA